MKTKQLFTSALENSCSEKLCKTYLENHELLASYNFTNKRLHHRFFPANFDNVQNTFWWMLLIVLELWLEMFQETSMVKFSFHKVTGCYWSRNPMFSQSFIGNICGRVFQNMLITGIQKKSYSKNYQKRYLTFFFSKVASCMSTAWNFALN